MSSFETEGAQLPVRFGVPVDGVELELVVDQSQSSNGVRALDGNHVLPNIHDFKQRKYWQNATERVDEYDPSLPEAAHLRAHQIEAVDEFRKGVRALAEGVMSGGMAILHPTGSGKTVTTAEIMRMLCREPKTDERPVRALMLVPGHQILGQTVGNEDEVGAIQTFAPHLTVGEYSGKRKSVDATVTVMNYQALPWAVARGDVEVIDPDIIICDEAHHIIDGTWADAVEKIGKDRILLGLTATPAFSEKRSISRLFPNILVRKTMKDGIEEGMLAGMRGFLYKGKARLEINRQGGDYAEEDQFRAIANSEDNYLAAKICAQEVAQGRRGVISCVPGFDRAHAKIMAGILSNTPVSMPNGQTRNIRAAFVGGEIHEKELRRIFDGYKRGDIDVITYVNLLLEGWDSPESDFTVLLRPTSSRVLAEQRIGRIIRPRIGKVATVHEIIYEIEGENAKSQVTHMDIMGQRIVSQGYHYSKRSESVREANRKYKQGPAHIFNIDDYKIDPELAGKIAELEAQPLEEIRVACGQEALPFEWLTSHILAHRFDITREEVDRILLEAEVPTRAEIYNEVSHIYYPPRASHVIAEHLGLPELPEGYLTLSQLVIHHRSYQQYGRVSKHVVAQAVEDEGVTPGLYVKADGSVVKAYPPETISIPPVVWRHSEKQEKTPDTIIELGGAVTSLRWLEQILVSPARIKNHTRQREVITAQSCLVSAINKLGQIPPQIYKGLLDEVKAEEIEPTYQMENVMKVKGLDFIGLLIAANKAMRLVEGLGKQTGKRVPESPAKKK